MVQRFGCEVDAKMSDEKIANGTKVQDGEYYWVLGGSRWDLVQARIRKDGRVTFLEIGNEGEFELAANVRIVHLPSPRIGNN